MICDFRSDTVTQPTSAMRAAMQAAPLGDDVFGDDPTVNALQDRAAELFGHEAAIFAPTGTMTNLMALMSHCQRGDEVICGQQWHTYRWEGGGMAVLGSIQPQPLAHAPDGTIALGDIEAAIKPDDPHFARTRLIAMENTTGGKVLPLDYLASVRALAQARGLATHLDGARVFNAASAMAQSSGRDVYAVVKEMARHFDSVSVCLSKGLGAPVGSVLVGSQDLIARARRVRKMLGGGMRQAGVVAAAGLYALDHHIERLAQDHARLGSLAAGLQGAAAANPALAGKLHVQPPHTNIVFVDLDASIADPLLAHLAAQGVRVTAGLYGSAMKRSRWVTHLDVGDAHVAHALQAVRDFRA
jgi:threonine aldolase